LRKVSLASSIYRIGKYAFKECTSLTSLPLASSTIINEGVFEGCTGLESVEIPVNITTISSYAFQNCTGMKHLSIPGTVTDIGVKAFDGCSLLEDVVYRGTVDPTSVGSFSGCDNLTHVCVFKSYSEDTFAYIPVYPGSTDPELAPLFEQENQCYEVAICTENSGFLTERMNATKWNGHWSGCGIPYCDNQTGPREENTCYSDKSTYRMVCYEEECEYSSRMKYYGYSVVLPFTNVKYQSLIKEPFLDMVSEITDVVDIDLATEINAKGNLLSLYFVVRTRPDAMALKSGLEEAIADPNCTSLYGDILCHGGNMTIVEKYKSAADHSCVSLFLLFLAMVLSIVAMN